jgi:UDP-galactopyranose mutase
MKYREESRLLKNTIISGRLGDYKYYDMHDTINHALDMFENIAENFAGKQSFEKLKNYQL